MKLHHLKPAPGSKTRKRRVGRGEAGRRGKTAGRGTKGTGARNKLRPGFEGGQLPIARRVPKLRGFNRPNKEYFALVNIGRLSEFPAKATAAQQLKTMVAKSISELDRAGVSAADRERTLIVASIVEAYRMFEENPAE